MAEVISLQSQLQSVNGRSASGDRMILPLSSMSEVLGDKNSSTLRQINDLERYVFPKELCKH